MSKVYVSRRKNKRNTTFDVVVSKFIQKILSFNDNMINNVKDNIIGYLCKKNTFFFWSKQTNHQPTIQPSNQPKKETT